MSYFPPPQRPAQSNMPQVPSKRYAGPPDTAAAEMTPGYPKAQQYPSASVPYANPQPYGAASSPYGNSHTSYGNPSANPYGNPQAPYGNPSAPYGNPQAPAPYAQAPVASAFSSYAGNPAGYPYSSPSSFQQPQPAVGSTVTYTNPVASATPSSMDWFSQSGFAQAVTSAAVSAAVSGDPGKTLGGLAASVEQSSTGWFQSKMGFLKNYFNVTHSYVAWKLLYVLIPVLPRGNANESITRSASRDVPYQSDEDLHNTVDSSSGLRLTPGRRPDMYIPLMSLITYVLLYGMNKRGNFHPDDLYNMASFGLLLLVLEVLLVKGAAYILSIQTLGFSDIVAVCGYKFTNMCLTVFVLLFLQGSRIVWICLWVWAAATAGLNIRKGLLSASGYCASVSQYMGAGTAGVDKVLALAVGCLQILWTWLLMPACTELSETK